MSTTLIFYEGIMQASRDRPILEGFRLVSTMCATRRVIIATSGDKSRVVHQLRTEKVQDSIAEVLDRSEHLAPLPLWERQIEVVRSRYPLELVIASDPIIVSWSIGHGIPALLFAHPGFALPAQRPVQGNRNWEELVNELELRTS